MKLNLTNIIVTLKYLNSIKFWSSWINQIWSNFGSCKLSPIWPNLDRSQLSHIPPNFGRCRLHQILVEVNSAKFGWISKFGQPGSYGLSRSSGSSGPQPVWVIGPAWPVLVVRPAQPVWVFERTCLILVVRPAHLCRRACSVYQDHLVGSANKSSDWPDLSRSSGSSRSNWHFQYWTMRNFTNCGISISFLFWVNFKFYYFSDLKYLLKIPQFQFSFNFPIQTSHFTQKKFKFSK